METPWDIDDLVRSEGRDPIDDPNRSIRRHAGTGLPSLDWELDALQGLVLVGASDPALAQALALSVIKRVALMDWTRSRRVAVFTPTFSRARVVRALLGSLARLDPRYRHFLTRDQARTWRDATDLLAAAAARLQVDDSPALTVSRIADRLAEMGSDALPLGLVVILDMQAIEGDRVQTELQALSRSLGRVPVLAVSREVGAHGQRDGSPCVANMAIALEAEPAAGLDAEQAEPAAGVEAKRAEPAADLDAERAVTCSVVTGFGALLAAGLALRWSPRTYRLEEAWGDDRPPEGS